MSSIFEGFLSTPEGVELFSERKFVACMLCFEAALARAQASVGLIPESAALSIIGTCKVELFDVAKIVRESVRAGSLAAPLVKCLKETVGIFNPEAAKFVHYGATHQDVVDTALALVTREALDVIGHDLRQSVEALLSLAERHALTPALARSVMQPASMTSLGLTCAMWSAPLLRSLQRLQSTTADALGVRLGGSATALAQMNGKSMEVLVHMAAALGLKASLPGWHDHRDEWLVLGCELAVLVGSLGKMAADISMMSQFEVAELAEPDDTAAGQATSGAARPGHVFRKVNPVSCMVAMAAARRTPQRVAALLAAMTQEREPALGNWQAELAEWPALLMLVHGAARAMARALPGLQVDVKRMAANIQAVRGEMPKELSDEWFAPALLEQASVLALSQIASQRNSLATFNGTVLPAPDAPIT